MTGIFSDLTGGASASRGFAAVTGFIRDGVGAVTPRWLHTVLSRDPRDIGVVVGADGQPSLAIQASLATRKGSQPFPSDGGLDLGHLAGVGAALTITVDPARAFVRSLTVPRAAMPRLDEVLALDLERATPFKRTEVYSAHRVLGTSGESARIEHVLVKSSLIGPILDAARAAKIPVKAIRISDASRASLNLLANDQRQRSVLTRMLRRATVAVAAIGAALAMAAFAVETWRLQDAVAAAELQQQQLTASVATLRRDTQDADRALQEARFARARRLAQPLVVAVLDDLSRRLPNTTWLTDARIDDGVISIEGHSANAAELVAILSRSPYVASAAFAAPITRDAQRGSERFQIRMTRSPAPKASP